MDTVDHFSALVKAVNAEKSRIASSGDNGEQYVSRELANAVQEYFTGVLQNLETVRTSVDKLAAAIDQMEIRVHKIRCQIPTLADKQFIENCIAEEHEGEAAETMPEKDSEKVDNSEAEDWNNVAKEAIDAILKVFPNGNI